jgi:hypothetical protein
MTVSRTIEKCQKAASSCQMSEHTLEELLLQFRLGDSDLDLFPHNQMMFHYQLGPLKANQPSYPSASCVATYVRHNS